MSKTSGFTLIELLVVIAIIGILSTVVLSSLNTARARANDATIQADIDAIRAQVAVIYDTNNLSYNTSGVEVKGDNSGVSCDLKVSPEIDGTILTNQTVQQALDHAALQSGYGIVCNIGASGSTFFIAGRYKSNTGRWWCLDHTVAKQWTSGTPPDQNTTLCQ